MAERDCDMNFALRIAAVTGASVLLAGIAWAGPDLLSDSGCDFWNLPRWNVEVGSYEKSQEEFGI
jgi:hypothetical protein